MVGAGRRPEELVDWVEAELRAGRFAEGRWFGPDWWWTRKFGVSRSVVREARAFLAGRGHIVRDGAAWRFAMTGGSATLVDWVRRLRDSTLATHADVAMLRTALAAQRTLFADSIPEVARLDELCWREILLRQFGDFIWKLESTNGWIAMRAWDELVFWMTRGTHCGWRVALAASLTEGLRNDVHANALCESAREWKEWEPSIEPLVMTQPPDIIRASLLRDLNAFDSRLCSELEHRCVLSGLRAPAA